MQDVVHQMMRQEFVASLLDDLAGVPAAVAAAGDTSLRELAARRRGAVGGEGGECRVILRSDCGYLPTIIVTTHHSLLCSDTCAHAYAMIANTHALIHCLFHIFEMPLGEYDEKTDRMRALLSGITREHHFDFTTAYRKVPCPSFYSPGMVSASLLCSLPCW